MLASSGYCGASVVCCNMDVEIGGVRFVDSVMWDIHQSSAVRSSRNGIDVTHVSCYPR
ncbi:unnamed protein product [Ectocarpus sp. CCAP 1310/34]|nr:unnamed protein product [Ectocarpus sp. CCAP 1310/34]